MSGGPEGHTAETGLAAGAFRSPRRLAPVAGADVRRGSSRDRGIEDDEREDDEREDDEREDDERPRGDPDAVRAEIILPLLRTDTALAAQQADVLGRRPPDFGALRRLLEEAIASERFVEVGPSRYVSLWRATRDRIARFPSEVLLGITADAPADLSEEGATPGPDDRARIVREFRRSPWSAAVHEQLLALGEAELRADRSGHARRCFEDVLEHGFRPGHRAAATVGLWLSLLQAPPDEAAAAFERAVVEREPPGHLPWFGEELEAEEVAERVRALIESKRERRGAAKPRPLARLELDSVPAVRAWPTPGATGRRQSPFPTPAAGSWTVAGTADLGPAFVQAGPRLIAVHDPPAGLLWWRERDTIEDDPAFRSDRVDLVPGVFSAVPYGRHMWIRWSTASERGLHALTAFDLRTGKVVLSTADDPRWDGIVPAGDPLLAEGSLWTIAAESARLEPGPVVKTFLVRMDPAVGRTLDVRALVGGSRALRRSSHRWRRGHDLLHYGDPPVVTGGRVLCAPGIGAVVSCDVRDTAVLWARTYERILEPDDADAASRRGGAPVPAGDTVVFAPRDHRGLFALDVATGELRWEHRIDESFLLIGSADGVLVLEYRKHFEGRSSDTGETIWARAAGRLFESPRHEEDFEDAVDDAVEEGRPERVLALADGALFAEDARGRVLRIDPATGATVESQPTGARSSPLDVVALEDRPTLLTAPVAARGPAPPELPPPPAMDLRLLRRSPRLFAPPPATPGTHVLIVSDGIVELADESGPRWRRRLADTLEEVYWIDGDPLLVLGDRLERVDLETGVARWTKETFVDLGKLAIGAGCIVSARRRGFILDAEDGRLIWRDRFPAKPRAVRFEGERIRFVDDDEKEDDEQYLVSFSRTLGEDEEWSRREYRLGTGAGIRRTEAVSGGAVALLHDGSLFEVRDDGSLIEYPASRRARTSKNQRPEAVSAHGLFRLAKFEGRRRAAGFGLVVRRDDPDWSLRASELAELEDGRLVEIDEDRVALTELSDGTQRTYVLPPRPWFGDFERIIEAEVSEGRLMVASEYAPAGPAHHQERAIRLDVFDLVPEQALVSRELRALDARGHGGGDEDDGDRPGGHRPPALVVRSGRAWILDSRGLALVRTAGEYDGTPVPNVVYRAALPGDATTLPGRGSPGATFAVAHDGDRFRIVAEIPNRELTPLRGVGEPFAGDRLEVALAREGEAVRFAVGVDAGGRGVVRPSGPDGARRGDDEDERGRRRDDFAIPRGTEVSVAHDARGGRTRYEIATPIASLGWLIGERAGLSAVGWEEAPSHGGLVPVAVWGDGLGSRLPHPPAHLLVELHPDTRAGAEAALEAAHAVSGADGAFETVLEHSDAVSASPSGFLAPVEEFIVRHPGEVSARELAHADLAIRERYGVDRHERIRTIAEAAGVPPAVVAHYELLAGSALLQELRVQGDGYPRCIAIGFEQPDGALRFAYFRKTPFDFEFPTWQIADRTDTDRWVEVRVPLIRVSMQDRPIAGLVFLQQGERAVLWGRTSLEVGGERHVVIDGGRQVPEVHGDAVWLDDPDRPGRRVRRGPEPSKRYDVVEHRIRFAMAVTRHLAR